MSYDYVILKIKSKKHSLKDLIDYKPPKGLIYIKLKENKELNINYKIISDLKLTLIWIIIWI
jgi:hypothetical protein